MKVLVIPTWYPNGADKLMGLYHKEFTKALNNLGIEANMLFIKRERLSKPFEYLFMKKKEIEQEENYEVSIYKMLNYAPINFDLQMKNYVKKLDYAFKDYLKTHDKPDVIHAHVTVPAGYAACILKEKYNIPVVVTEHCGDLERFFNKEPFKKYGKYVLENSTYSCVSDYMKEIALKYSNECFVLPNTVNTKIFNNNINRKIGSTFRFVSACALREGKKLDVAFQAIKILKEKKIKVHLDVIGDGFLEQYYKNVCQELGLIKEVSFLGRKSKEEMASIFKREHALLISSELESFAIPGIEGLASGLPIVSTDCLGPRMFVNKSTGILCKVNDHQDLALAMQNLIKNYDKYKPEKLKQMANQFSEENVVNTAKKIYQHAIKNN